MLTKKPSLFEHLQQLTSEVAGAKLAAATPADPGGHAGSSTHPTANVDNHGQTPSEGARSKENESDVEEAEGAPSVNKAPDATDRQDQVQLNIGTQAAATGEDPSVEDNFKGTKDDPGTSSPFSTEDGQKYGQMAFGDIHKVATDLGNAVRADYANGFGLGTAPAPKGTPPAAKTAGAQTPVAPAVAADLQAGYELAASLGLNKQAAEGNVRDFLQAAVQDAVDDAARVINVIKQAAEEEVEESEPPAEGAEGGGGAPPAPAEGGGAPPPGGGGAPPDLGALLGGGGGGAPPPGAGMGGGDPSLEAQPPSEEEALQELAMALQELGIPVEALAAAAGGGAGGGMAPPPGGDMGGGGMAPPPPGGEMVPPPPEAGGGMAPPLGKVAAAAQLAQNVKAFMRSGRFQIKEAKTKRARDLRDRMKGHLLELTRR